MNLENFARERALFDAMAGWTTEAIVIGGYAVSTRSVPRYSVDLDLVLPRSAVPAARAELERGGLRSVAERPNLEQNYGGSWERWEGGPQRVTIDLLVGSVTDREFRMPLPYEALVAGAELLPLRGAGAQGPRMRVASREVLIALKVQPMRPRDVGDIICLAGAGWNAADLEPLIDRLAGANPAHLKDRLAILEAALDGTDDELNRRLGPRIPGLRRPRLDAARAARRLGAEILARIPRAHP